MSASSRLDLDNELNRNDEIRNDVDFEDGDFPGLKPNHDWREHAHHKHLGQNPHKCRVDFASNHQIKSTLSGSLRKLQLILN